MATNLTLEAAAGWDWQRADHAGKRPAHLSCPYLQSSPSGMAWHLGRHLAKGGFARPSGRPGESSVFQGRGYSLRLDFSAKPTDRATLFHWHDDNTFTEV